MAALQALRRALGVGIALVLLTCPELASANGRFPRAQQLVEDPTDPNHLLLAATYGLLVTEDRGQHWYHVCEDAFADAGAENDSLLARLPDGTVLVGAFATLTRSVDGLCDFKEAFAPSPTQTVPDFSVDANGTVLAVLTSRKEGVTTAQLQESTDGGLNFSPLGPPLPNDVRVVATLDVAPGDPERIYLSGLDANGQGILLRSSDRGQSFTSRALVLDAASGEVPYIAAIDPRNADVLYVRTDLWRNDETREVREAADALLYSDDGGDSFGELIRASGKLFGFALAPDGSDVLVGYGDPVEGAGRATQPGQLGIYRAPAGSKSFERVFPHATSCLAWTKQGVYACTTQADAGASLLQLSPEDLKPDITAGATPLLNLLEVVGPLACSSCTSSKFCPDFWESTCRRWGRTDCEATLVPMPGAEACPEGGAAGVAGGTGVTPSDGGRSAEPSAGAPSSSGETTDEPEPPTDGDNSGCGCTAVGSPLGAAGWYVFVLLGLLVRCSKSNNHSSSVALSGQFGFEATSGEPKGATRSTKPE